jgi:hypothetical protein
MSPVHPIASIPPLLSGSLTANVARDQFGSKIPQCRSWVNLDILSAGRPLPVYPDEQTLRLFVGMSQACRERTLALQQIREIQEIIQHWQRRAVSQASLDLPLPRVPR